MQELSNKLRFHSKWFEFGLLPASFFEEQIAICSETGGPAHDPNPEHYRYHAFKTILAQRESLSDLEMEQYLVLCSLDPDRNMAQSALLEMLTWPGLSNVQFQKLTQLGDFQTPTAQKLIWRKRTRASLQHGPVPEAIFTAIIHSKDSTFQAELLSTAALTEPQLEALADQGGSRAVRNRAQARLASRK